MGYQKAILGNAVESIITWVCTRKNEEVYVPPQAKQSTMEVIQDNKSS